jgi:UPF0755 protein
MSNFSSFKILSLAAFVILLLTLGLREIAPGPRSAPDFDGFDRGSEIIVHIEPGMSGSEIGEVLAKENVVKSALAYFRAAIANPDSERIAPGEHRIETRIPATEAVLQLLDSDRIVNLVRVRDGARLSEIRKELVLDGFDEAKVASALSKLKPPADFKLNSLEGFLYPAFYSFPRGTSELEAVEAMINRFEESTRGFNWKVQNFSPDEILVIASLIEAEGTPDVFGKVSRVVYNRLAKGMKLQFDYTVHYVLDSRGDIRLSLKETEVESKYNTYRYEGLPPGPIGSPTSRAIEAALDPEAGDWLYFVTVLPGETKFTASYDEFLKFKAEYKRNYANGAFER